MFSLFNRRAHTVGQAASIAGLSRSQLYRAIRTKRLIARKNGRRTLILLDDLESFLKALPVLGGIDSPIVEPPMLRGTQRKRAEDAAA